MHLEDDGSWYGTLYDTEMLPDEIQEMFKGLKMQKSCGFQSFNSIPASHMVFVLFGIYQ